jgi:hypothetical protein
MVEENTQANQMIKFFKELFRERAWKEISREFLRKEQAITGGTSAYYYVTYKDVLSGDIKSEEVEIVLQEWFEE